MVVVYVCMYVCMYISGLCMYACMHVREMCLYVNTTFDSLFNSMRKWKVLQLVPNRQEL